MVYEPWVLSNILSWLFPSTSDTFEITHNIFMAHSPHQVIYRQANSHSRNVVQTGKEWSGQQDLNLRPSAPKADALPDCAMPRRNWRSIHASILPGKQASAGVENRRSNTVAR